MTFDAAEYFRSPDLKMKVRIFPLLAIVTRKFANALEWPGTMTRDGRSAPSSGSPALSRVGGLE